MAITAALAVSAALLFPRLRHLLWAYVAAVAFTRVMFGAYFPLDVLAGTALATAGALPVVIAFELTRRPAGRRRGRSWTGRPSAPRRPADAAELATAVRARAG